MALLDVECAEHGVQETYSHTGTDTKCPTCGKPAKRLWTSPPIHNMDFRYGWDPGAGKYFDRKADRETWIRESGSRRIKD